ncbi:hypothetical protein OG604_48890 [Streptomyces sp. NBC_01231]|nr:hypothetical protein OG604_48890 [Streptomyces sp. NBC_01231]
MANQGRTFTIRVEDLALDHEGRVTILDPQLAQSMAAAMVEPPDETAGLWDTTNNCNGGNCVKGCGKK